MSVEIVPPNGDYSQPTETWKFHTDQDRLPPWYDTADAEKRVRAELAEWRRYHACTIGNGEANANHIGGDIVVESAGDASTQTAGSLSTQTAGDASTQKAGEGTCQVVRYYDGKWLVATRIVLPEHADRWYVVSGGVWRECTPEECEAAEKKIAVV